MLDETILDSTSQMEGELEWGAHCSNLHWLKAEGKIFLLLSFVVAVIVSLLRRVQVNKSQAIGLGLLAMAMTSMGDVVPTVNR